MPLEAIERHWKPSEAIIRSNHLGEGAALGHRLERLAARRTVLLQPLASAHDGAEQPDERL